MTKPFGDALCEMIGIDWTKCVGLQLTINAPGDMIVVDARMITTIDPDKIDIKHYKFRTTLEETD